jgi:hypothetical protein
MERIEGTVGFHLPKPQPLYDYELKEFEESHYRYIETLPPEQHAQVQAAFAKVFKEYTTPPAILRAIEHTEVFLPLQPATLVAEFNTYIRSLTEVSEVIERIWRALVLRTAKGSSLEEIRLEQTERAKTFSEREGKRYVMERKLDFLLNEQVPEDYFTTASFYRDIVEFLNREHVTNSSALFWSVLDQLEAKLPKRRGAIRLIREIAHMPPQARKRILGEEIPSLS